MSVDKFIVSHEESGFTTLPNEVIQGLRNAEALGLWCFCASLPPGWEFHKDMLQIHFGFGRDKSDKLFKILEQTNLIQITQTRDKNGRFKDWKLHVQNGRDFIMLPVDNLPTSPFTDFQGTARTPVNIDSAPRPGLPFTANQGLVNSIYKEHIINKTKSRNETKSSFVQNQKKHAFAESMDAMASESKEIEAHNQRKRIEMGAKRSNQIKSIKEELE